MLAVGRDNLFVEEVLTAFTAFCDPKTNETMEIDNFFTRHQGQDESCDKYLTELRTLTITCNFGNITDSLIRNRIVCGTWEQGTFTQRDRSDFG